jgi:putative MATE family efflux protein
MDSQFVNRKDPDESPLSNTSSPTPATIEKSATLLIDQTRPIWWMVLTLAWPVLLQQLLIFFVLVSDRYLAGHFQKTGLISYQAAQTTAHYLAWFINSYSVLVTVGSTALVARFTGARDRDMAIHVTNQSLILSVSLGLVGTVAGLWGLPDLVRFLQLHGDAADLAARYLRPLFLLLTLQIVEYAGIACLVGAGDTRTGMWVLGGIAIVNIPLAWLFYHGWGPIPAFGFEGIAWGTAISHAIGGVVVLAFLVGGRGGLRIHLRLLRPNWDLQRRLLRISIPAGMDSLSVILAQFWFLSIVNRLGETASGAHGLALCWEALGYFSGIAFGTAAMSLIGQNLGARRPDQAARCGWVAFGLGSVFMSSMGAVFFFLAPQMFALFCPHPSQQPIVDAGVPVLRLVAFAMPACASTMIFTFALRGAGDTRIPLVFTWIGLLGVRIPLAYYLTSSAISLGIGGSISGGDGRLLGAWIAMCTDLYVRGLFFLLRFAGKKWQRIKV